MSKQKTVMITGIAGFIGFHLALFLKKRGDVVFGLDNFNDYYLPALKEKRKEILSKEGIEVIEGDITKKGLVQEITKKWAPTHLVHLAAQAGVRYSLENPRVYASTNVDGFVEVLECVRSFPKIKLVYASSSSVYGLNTKTPFSEADPTENQASLYGVTKKANELMAKTYHHLFDISAIGLRFFTVYGPWGRPDMAYFSFTQAILEEKPIKVFNHGKLQRDFTYIDDIVEGTAAALDVEAGYEIFNLGNNRPIELIDFISTLENLLGKRALKEFCPMQSGDVFSTYADLTKSHKILNFSPKTSIEEGLKKYTDWHKKTFSSSTSLLCKP